MSVCQRSLIGADVAEVQFLDEIQAVVIKHDACSFQMIVQRLKEIACAYHKIICKHLILW